ncbi:MAG TPA: hypothetical protein DCG49_07810 [Ruminococcus sp.]|nr:hypothetical protein [Ruminococcus sp.]
MIEYNEEYDAYAVEFEDAVICWDDEPDDDYAEVAAAVRKAYHQNIRHIAEVILEEIREMFAVQTVDEVIEKLGRPTINPDNGQVTYDESRFDAEHIISFEYLDDDFDEIQYVSIDG